MTPALIPVLHSQAQIHAEVNGCLGLITLNRPEALNALSLAMIRDITALLQAWREASEIQAVMLLAAARPGKAPVFCAGGDIRFFHVAALNGDAGLDDFFTEEYALNHLIHQYPKPYIALMDGLVIGGGMGISQGARLRVLTERSRLAMPETHIGLFPDVGGGFFLGQCPGHVGQWLALTGEPIAATEAIEYGLGDVFIQSAALPALIENLRHGEQASAEHVIASVMEHADLAPASSLPPQALIDRHFGQPDIAAIIASLKAADDPWSARMLAKLLQRSPLMLAVTLEQLRRARAMTLAEDLRMERDMVHQCFHLRPLPENETVEGIRALVIDKDHAPRWKPSAIEAVTPAMVQAYFDSPWTPALHPLRGLK